MTGGIAMISAALFQDVSTNQENGSRVSVPIAATDAANANFFMFAAPFGANRFRADEYREPTRKTRASEAHRPVAISLEKAT